MATWDNCAEAEKGVATLNCFPVIFQRFVLAALILVGIAAVIFIIISGIKFITSSGDPKRLEGARHTLTYAIVGLLVVLSAFAIVNVVSIVTGVPCINFAGFSRCQ